MQEHIAISSCRYFWAIDKAIIATHSEALDLSCELPKLTTRFVNFKFILLPTLPPTLLHYLWLGCIFQSRPQIDCHRLAIFVQYAIKLYCLALSVALFHVT